MIHYTILFSLGTPQENPYVYCAMLWLKSLFASGTAQKGDKIAILCDEETLKHLKTINLFRLTGVELVVVPKPRDAREGMNLKYVFRPQVDAVVVYSDVDQIFRKPFRPELPPDTLLLYPEGSIEHPNYRGDYPLRGGQGFTAGIWAYRPGVKMTQLLDDCLETCRTSEKKFYTLDQPHFNFCIAKIRPPMALMKKETISFNGNNDLKECHVLNLCGDPGSGHFHFTKMLDMWLIL